MSMKECTEVNQEYLETGQLQHNVVWLLKKALQFGNQGGEKQVCAGIQTESEVWWGNREKEGEEFRKRSSGVKWKPC